MKHWENMFGTLLGSRILFGWYGFPATMWKIRTGWIILAASWSWKSICKAREVVNNAVQMQSWSLSQKYSVNNIKECWVIIQILLGPILFGIDMCYQNISLRLGWHVMEDCKLKIGSLGLAPTMSVWFAKVMLKHILIFWVIVPSPSVYEYKSWPG